MMARRWIEVPLTALSLFLLTVWLTWPAREAGFTSDFTAHVEMFLTKAELGWWNSFGWRGNQPVLFGLMYLWYEVFGMAPTSWFLLFAGLHALNGTLLFLLMRRLQAPFALALAGALIFTLHPYQAEVLTWKVCLHYLLSTGALLGMLLLLLRSGPWGWGRWICLHGLFLLALFSLELALIYPVMLGVTLWWRGREEGWLKEVRLCRAVWLLAPQGVFIGLYFLWNRLRLGHWVGHYGDEVHLGLTVREFFSHILNYFFKYLAFSRDWPHAWKGFMGEIHFREPGLMYAMALSGLVVLGVMLWRARTASFRVGVWAVLLFFLALAPVISLYFAWIGHNENDRYGYLASAFFVAAMVFLTRKWPRYLMIAALALYGGAGVWLFRANVDRWAQCERVYAALLRDYRWQEAPEVWVLGMPDSYEGIMLFRGYRDGEGLQDALRWVHGHGPGGAIREVAAFVMRQPLDGLEARWLDDRRIRVTFRQWGNWFVRSGMGAGDYHGEGYAVDFDEGGYTLTLEEPRTGRIFIYSDGGRWKVLEASNKPAHN